MTKSSRKIRVLIFTTHLGSGGAEMQALRIANHLDRKRFDVEAAVMRGGGNYEPDLASDVDLHVLGGSRLPAKTRSLRRLLRRERYDIVCSFLELPNLVAAFAAWRLTPGPRLVACVQAPPSINWQGSGRRRVVRAIVSRYYRRADQIIAISKGVADDVAAMAPGAEAHTATVYNAGVDDRVEALASRPLEAAESRPPRPLVLACGRLTEQKGFPYLLDAFAQVRKRVPGANLWILGEGQDRPHLERQIADLRIGDRVRLLGFRDNPYRYMAAADLFVLSSIFEGFGNVVAEAMACGTPVVSTDCPHGPGEIITDGVNGLLVPPRDPKALADSLVRVLQDPALAKKLGKAGKVRAQDFTSTEIAGQYAEVFESLVRGS
jgi:glycosyltransferase involved in cell wall biosynthesis